MSVKRFCDRCDEEIPAGAEHGIMALSIKDREPNLHYPKKADLCGRCHAAAEEFMRPMPKPAPEPSRG